MVHVRLCSLASADDSRLTSTEYCICVLSGAVTVMVMRVTAPASRLILPVVAPFASAVAAAPVASSSYTMVLSGCAVDAVRAIEVSEWPTDTA